MMLCDVFVISASSNSFSQAHKLACIQQGRGVLEICERAIEFFHVRIDIDGQPVFVQGVSIAIQRLDFSNPFQCVGLRSVPAAGHPEKRDPQSPSGIDAVGLAKRFEGRFPAVDVPICRLLNAMRFEAFLHSVPMQFHMLGNPVAHADGLEETIAVLKGAVVRGVWQAVGIAQGAIDEVLFTPFRLPFDAVKHGRRAFEGRNR